MKTLKSIMEKNVETVDVDSPVREAAQKMRRERVGAIPVTQGGRVVGMITDRDITIRTIGEDRSPEFTRAGDIMTREVVSCSPETSLIEAAEIMDEEEVGRLIVVDKNDRLKGIVSLGSLIHFLGEERVAGLVEEDLEEEEGRSPFLRGVFLAPLTAAAFVFAGAYAVRRSPRMRETLRQRLPVRFRDRFAA